MKKYNQISIMVTHSGAFHADEVMAAALLAKFASFKPVRVSEEEDVTILKSWLENGKAPIEPRWFPDGVKDEREQLVIVRTRNESLLNAAKANRNVLVADVGAVHERNMLNFDHHQKGGAGQWSDGTPFSSTGLVWGWLKDEGYLDEMSQAEVKELEASLIKPLDAHDNGKKRSRISGRIAEYNRLHATTAEQSAQFRRAMLSLDEKFDNVHDKIKARLYAQKVIKEKWEQARKKGNQYVIVSETLDYGGCPALLSQVSGDSAMLIALRGDGNRFSLVSLPAKGGAKGAFSVKCPMLSEWRGKKNIKVSRKSGGGYISLPFCHNSGYMCVVEGSYKDVATIAATVVARNKKTFKNKKTC